MKVLVFKSANKAIMLFVATALFICACKKNEYFVDGGTTNAGFNGTVMQYLQSKPANFDTIVSIVKLAGLEQVLTKDTVTLFVPQDYSVRKLVLFVNRTLFLAGKDTVKKLDEIDGLIWRKYFSNYLYKGANKLKDYPQLDITAKGLYQGQNYFSYNKEIFNIGVIYASTGGVKYSGYRQLNISYIPNPAKPLDNWVTIPVTSSDIQPEHSVVHVLTAATHIFGFDPINFAQDVLLTK